MKGLHQQPGASFIKVAYQQKTAYAFLFFIIITIN